MGFDYHCPERLDAAAALVAAGGRVLAGGQSLMPLVKRGTVKVDALVDINRLEGLDTISEVDGRIRIGALARLEQVRLHPLIRARLPLLADALRSVANPAIRRRGTLVGNLIQDGPGTEAPAVAALADVRYDGLAAGGVIEAAAALPAGTLVTAARFRPSPRGTRAAFLELQRRFGHLCTLGCGIEILPGGAIRAVLAGYAATPLVSPALDAALAARRLDDDNLAGAVESSLGGRPVRGDLHADAAYRRAAMPALVRRTLAAASSMEGAA